VVIVLGSLLPSFAAPAASVPSRPLDLLVVAAPADRPDFTSGGQVDTAGKVASFAVRCWERTATQDAMHGQMVGGALGMAAPKGRQVSAGEVKDLVKAGGWTPPRRACAALAPSLRQAGGTVSYQPVAGDRNRCVVGGLSPEAMARLFSTCFDI
jgi:hypothetical protein